MKDLAIFKNAAFGSIRVVMVDGEPWFLAKDVCGILGLGNASQALDMLDCDEKSVLASIINNDTLIDFNGLRKDSRIISESGLYALILRSRKPEAKDFSRWVRKEILPSLRKTGHYGVEQKSFADMLIEAGEKLKESEEKRQALEAEKYDLQVDKVRLQLDNLKKKNIIRTQSDHINANLGRVCIGKAFERGKGCYSLGEAARQLKQMIPGLDIGRNRFASMLRKHGFLLSGKKTRYQPSQKSLNNDLMKSEIRQSINKYGYPKLYEVALITRKGLEFFARYFAQQCLWV